MGLFSHSPNHPGEDAPQSAAIAAFHRRLFPEPSEREKREAKDAASLRKFKKAAKIRYAFIRKEELYMAFWQKDLCYYPEDIRAALLIEHGIMTEAECAAIRAELTLPPPIPTTMSPVAPSRSCDGTAHTATGVCFSRMDTVPYKMDPVFSAAGAAGFGTALAGGWGCAIGAVVGLVLALWLNRKSHMQGKPRPPAQPAEFVPTTEPLRIGESLVVSEDIRSGKILISYVGGSITLSAEGARSLERQLESLAKRRNQ